MDGTAGKSTTKSHVNERKFDTELAAVWFAANYYYGESYKRGGEDIGVVFEYPDGKYGLTIRKDGNCEHSQVRYRDVPEGAGIAAIWHTHLPLQACLKNPEAKKFGAVNELLSSLIGASYDNFSGDDVELADTLTELSKKKGGPAVPIYLITESVIKRYTPGVGEKAWPRDHPQRVGKQK